MYIRKLRYFSVNEAEYRQTICLNEATRNFENESKKRMADVGLTFLSAATYHVEMSLGLYAKSN